MKKRFQKDFLRRFDVNLGPFRGNPGNGIFNGKVALQHKKSCVKRRRATMTVFAMNIDLPPLCEHLFKSLYADARIVKAGRRMIFRR